MYLSLSLYIYIYIYIERERERERERESEREREVSCRLLLGVRGHLLAVDGECDLRTIGVHYKLEIRPL